jgi:ribokinase
MVDVRVAGRAHAATIELRPGGSALNAALWAAALGADAIVVGRVGDDFAGRALATFVAESGLQAEITVDPVLATGTVAVVDGDLRVDRGANTASWEPACVMADVALFSGYLPAGTITAARARLEAQRVALALGRLDRLPIDPDIVIGNAGEAERITGERDPTAAALRLAADGRLACVTLGPDGALAARGQDVLHASAPVRHPQGVHGAGDAFAAGLLLALATDAPLAEALTAGCQVGTRAVESGGTRGLAATAPSIARR